MSEWVEIEPSIVCIQFPSSTESSARESHFCVNCLLLWINIRWCACKGCSLRKEILGICVWITVVMWLCSQLRTTTTTQKKNAMNISTVIPEWLNVNIWTHGPLFNFSCFVDFLPEIHHLCKLCTGDEINRYYYTKKKTERPNEEPEEHENFVRSFLNLFE